MEFVDGGGDVLRAQAAGDDEVELGRELGEDGAGFRPGEGDAGSTERLADLGVDEDVVDRGVVGDLAEVLADVVGAGGIGFDDPMHGLNDFDAALEAVVQRGRKGEVYTAVKLYRGEASLIDDFRDLFGIAGLKDSDFLDGCGKMWGDCGDLRGGDAAFAGSEDEAYRVSAQCGGEKGVFEVGVGADLDPHDLISLRGLREGVD